MASTDHHDVNRDHSIQGGDCDVHRHFDYGDDKDGRYGDIDDDDDDDIYRGTPVRSRSVSPSTISTASSPSLFAGGRLGAIAAVVELAISRWARGNSSGSSTSSSSISSSSVSSRSQRDRLRRRRSVVTLQSVQSERDIAARISRLKAREESRKIPRRFTLYAPPQPKRGKANSMDQRVTQTNSLPPLLPQLEAALKVATRARRNQTRHRSAKARSKRPMNHQDYMIHSAGESSTSTALPPAKVKAWFLDVASPSWEDMRTLGKMLHLHPLTLEDILQRDPREKMEHFPKLGYHFISFRAIDTQEDAKALDVSGQDGQSGGLVGEAHVYLVVFDEGICSFHFTDITEHTDRVRNRIMQLEEVFNMSSDWIAHGMLDSIVDSFFPLLEEIGREVVAIEEIVLNTTPFPELHMPPTPVQRRDSDDKRSTLIDSLAIEKHSMLSLDHAKPRFSSPRLTFPLALRRLKRSIITTWHLLRKARTQTQPIPKYATLRRMARARRLVTSLTRLLATKLEVVAQIRKRLLTSSHGGWNDNVDVAIYMGDVQDHILTLQQSLSHYDRILNHSHSSYLSQLRVRVKLAKATSDKTIIYLTFVSVAVVCIQTLVGVFSMNVTVPTNGHELDDKYYLFGVIISTAVCFLSTYAFFCRRWLLANTRLKLTHALDTTL